MYTYKIKLDRVVDGDTVDAYIDLGFDVSVKKRIRFMGINTPESRTRDLEEKAKGLGELHVDMVDGKECLTLANVNELLIKEGHAVEYHGGKR